MHVLIPLGMFYPVYTNGINPIALSDVNCLFSVVVHLGIHVADFDVIFDCIMYMIGHFLFCKLSIRCHVTEHAKDWVL